MLDHDCVLAELRQGVGAYPLLADALELEWLQIANLEALDELRCFVKWAGLIGSRERDLGEASVLAAAELRAGIAITDDRDATVVARHHGAKVHGTIWHLAQGCRNGKLTRIGAGSIVDALRTTGARLPCTGREFPAYATEHGLMTPVDHG
ncbi:hypothetical protein [Actinoplanes sp. M2I2]|uniref:hypothetical protein n=1 Tax=Actinoplanes sp. M2I2 TaxID=1734444 RepID=UPI00201FC3C4|nr:hypothetical protein [Actinoplanes sp. M2I2]